MTTVLLGIGIFGILGISVLCPLLACLAYSIQSKRSPLPPDLPAAFSTVEVLIPVYNEAATVRDTLLSIQESIKYLHHGNHPGREAQVTIHVASNGCTDGTEAVVRAFPGVKLSALHGNTSKWIALKTLLAACTAGWVVLVDAGARWPETLLTDFAQRLKEEPNALALAPSYIPLNVSWLSRLNWKVEYLLKCLESCAGGPISLHGATVAYPRAALQRVLDALGENQIWLNDDVVIPLKLRSLFPDGQVVYPAGWVADAEVNSEKLDIRRRTRLLLGNLQWAAGLLLDSFRQNPVAGLLACRRLFRVLWAYWLTSLGVGLVVLYPGFLLPGLLLLAWAMMSSGSFRQMAGAAAVSLLAPFHFARPESRRFEVSWK